jgi:hypothetical protein
VEDWLSYALKHGMKDVRNTIVLRILSFEILADLWIRYPRIVEQSSNNVKTIIDTLKNTFKIRTPDNNLQY